MKKIATCGSGAYGTVYLSSDGLAVKRNIVEKTVTGSSVIRELDILMRIGKHPFIIDIKSISFGNPFSEKLDRLKKNTKEDNIFFLMDYADYNCREYIQKCDPEKIKIMLCQLLLAVEYIHSKDVIHCDLKPNNLLVFTEPFRLVVTDFGLSQNCNSDLSEISMTAFYRAPEVCLNKEYGKKADMWSVGCIAFEMVTRKHYVYNVKDRNSLIIAKIMENKKKDYCKNAILNISKKSFVESFNSTTGSIEEYTDLVSKLLEVEPEKRLSATEALEHPFFNGLRDYIKEVRELFPPKAIETPKVVIKRSVEREWLKEIIVNMLKKKNLKLAALFHAVDLFDRYMESKEPNTLSKKQVTELVYSFVYMMYKYFSILNSCDSVEMVVGSIKDYEVLEKKLLKDMFNFSIYRETVYEKVKDKNPKELLLKYIDLNEDLDMTLDQLIMCVSKNG
ncbi:MAG: hypothetical protein KatS3mg101_0804 [Patescibacteria group bacterium]|nr:MAG: hypothetical protein KatS3mg101_0804 [Patescibacteria group bacterium]